MKSILSLISMLVFAAGMTLAAPKDCCGGSCDKTAACCKDDKCEKGCCASGDCCKKDCCKDGQCKGACGGDANGSACSKKGHKH